MFASFRSGWTPGVGPGDVQRLRDLLRELILRRRAHRHATAAHNHVVTVRLLVERLADSRLPENRAVMRLVQECNTQTATMSMWDQGRATADDGRGEHEEEEEEEDEESMVGVAVRYGSGREPGDVDAADHLGQVPQFVDELVEHLTTGAQGLAGGLCARTVVDLVEDQVRPPTFRVPSTAGD